jgi:hypothetical protein
MMEKIAKPFLKWAGGKTQLITEIERVLPNEIKNQNSLMLNHSWEAVQYYFGC